MARTATAEVSDSFEGQRRDVPFKLKDSRIPPGSAVILRGNFEADFGSRQKKVRERGWTKNYVMKLVGDTYEATVPDLGVGDTYEYRYYVEPPGGTPFTLPRGKADKMETTIGPEAEKSPSTTYSFKDVQTRLKKRVSDILEATKSHESAQGLEALFDQLKTEMDVMSIREDQTPMILSIVVESIRENAEIPPVLRSQFSDKQPPPANITELQVRLEKGARLYRQQVFNALRADKDSREAFSLGQRASYDPANPLGNPKSNKLFDRLCSERDLLSFVPWLGVSLNSVSNVPCRSPALDAQRFTLLGQVIDRLTPEQKSAIAQIHPDRKAQLIETAVSTGLLATAFTTIPPSFLVAAGLWVGKGIIEGGTGIRIADLVKSPDGKAIWKKFKENNFLTRMFKKGESLGDITREGISSWWQRSTPWGAWKHGAESHFEVPDTGAEPLTEGRNGVLIRKACDAAIG